MSNSFSTVSREIVDSFVHDVLFIDERAYRKDESEENPAQDFNLASVSKSFAEKGKLCSFYAPSTKEDIEVCKSLILRPDMVVLDWDIFIPEAGGVEDETADVDDDDRGLYTKQFIRVIVEDASDQKIKVVVVYTGQPDLHDIVNQINMSLANDSFSVNLDNCEVSSKNVRILVRSKSNQPSAHSPFKHFMVSYENLPDLLVSAFSEFVEGLMPCFAMKCMTEIRESSAKILGVYHRGLDAELLAHELAIPNPEDTRSYISNSFGSAITDLIMGNEDIDIDRWVEKWIESVFSQNPVIKSIAGKRVNVSKDTIRKFFINRITKPNLSIRFNSAFGISVEGEDLISVTNQLSRLFHQNEMIIDKSRYEFASLLHKKNLFSMNIPIPVLTLGSVVEKLDDGGEYYLCIQQRCDSVRIPREGRDFLFLPLAEDKQRSIICAISIAPGKCLYVPKASYNIAVFHFSPTKAKLPIKANIEDNSFVFTTTEGIRLKWLAELKELNAQRIVAEFTSQLSRVGLDEAEWLRIEGMN